MIDRITSPSTLEQFVRWLMQAPASTTISAADLVSILGEFSSHEPIAATQSVTPPIGAPEPSWRVRIWSVPPETRLTVREAAEALGRPVSFVYRRTSAKAADGDRLPCRKLDSELTFVAGELRTWIQDHEEVIESGRITPPTLTISGRRPATRDAVQPSTNHSH